jgi:hypothetical protein
MAPGFTLRGTRHEMARQNSPALQPWVCRPRNRPESGDRIAALIPNLTLVEIHTMAPQEFPNLLLKREFPAVEKIEFTSRRESDCAAD